MVTVMSPRSNGAVRNEHVEKADNEPWTRKGGLWGACRESGKDVGAVELPRCNRTVQMLRDQQYMCHYYVVTVMLPSGNRAGHFWNRQTLGPDPRTAVCGQRAASQESMLVQLNCQGATGLVGAGSWRVVDGQRSVPGLILCH